MVVRQPCRALGLSMPWPSATQEMTCLSQEESECLLDFGTIQHVFFFSHTLRVWELSPQTRKIVATDCNLGQLKRIVQCIQVSPNDDYMYCGTSSGDILQVWRCAVLLCLCIYMVCFWKR